MRLYEGMFLIEAGRAARNWEATESELLSILEKHGARMRQETRYDERKLAYPVAGHRRGAYLLTYFEAEPSAIAEMNVDLNLSEVVLRSLIVRVDGGAVPEAGALGNMAPMKPGERPRRVAEEEARAAAERTSMRSEPRKAPPPAEGAGEAKPAPAAKPAADAPAAEEGEAKKDGEES